MTRALFTRVPYHTVPLQFVPKSGTERVVFTRVRKKIKRSVPKQVQRLGKVKQKLKRYDMVPFRSRVNRSGTISYRSVQV